tara:strand:+ start:1284 stop:1550 length:267 start_codon:yes stop_codon:yes gene_type:complete
METFLTVMMTLAVVALIGAVAALIKLWNKVEELETEKLDRVDDHIRLERELHSMGEDMMQRIDGWVASTDRRFDKLINDFSKVNKTIK